MFSAERPQNLAEASPPDEEAVSAETPELGADILVRQGDQTYSAGDQATVQKWIIERRLNREGLISMDGASWTPLHEVAALQPFLEVVEKLQLLEVPVQAPDEPAPEEEVSLLAPEEEVSLLDDSPETPQFAEVAELESLVDVEPADTHDELDADPFPTEEVPLPPAPIAPNLSELDAAALFDAPNTGEVDFDYPLNDDSTLDSELIELPKEPGLPSLSHARSMVDVEVPGFVDEQLLSDFPTEDELTLSEEEEDVDPLGNEIFASLDSDWDEDDEDDLAWVNDKKRGRRIVAALLLFVLILLTGKLFLERKAKNERIADNLASMELKSNPDEAIEVITEPDDKEATDPDKEDEEAPEDLTAEVVETPAPAPKPAPAPTPRAKRSSSSSTSSSAPEPNQAQLSRTAREAQTRRGPQPTTAADFVDRGRQAISEGDYNAARLYYLDAVDMEPQNAAANQGLAFAALQQGDAPFAIRHFCIALNLSSPNSSMAQETQRALNDLNTECP